jgi:hypothetical protein
MSMNTPSSFLTPSGQQAMQSLAQRHGLSLDAVITMLQAVRQGSGTMAQFSHPEFGGSGQWMAGGMTMVSDLFNHALKARVDNLCSEISALLAQRGDGLFAAPPPGAAGMGMAWWPADLRFPDSTGGQNGSRYAVFNQAGRVVVETGNTVTVYDSTGLSIGGVQQQSGSLLPSFSGPFGTIEASRLPVLSVNGQPVAPVMAAPPPMASMASNMPPASSASGGAEQIFASIDRLAELHARGVLTNEEFAAKKAELLSRL